MFKKLREKLKSWTKKVSDKAEVVEDTQEVVEKQKKPKETKKEDKEKTPETKEKVELPTPEKYPEPPFGEKIAQKKELEKPDKTQEKEVKIPQTFDPGKQKFEPDLEKIKEITNEIEDETKKLKKLEKEKELKEKSKEIKKKEEKIAEVELGKTGFFKKITSKITKVKISQKDFEEYKNDLEMVLLENNVAFSVVERIIKKLGEEIIGKTFIKKEIADQIELSLKDILRDILIDPPNLLEKIEEKKELPYVILFCGINGTGKTTTIAKIAKELQEKNKSVVLAAADTFRAASIEQIQKHGEKLGIKVISQNYGTDPAAVGFDAIKYAKKNKIDVVLIDTAGRMHSEKNLLKELEKIKKVTNPDFKIFVGEAITGNDSVEQVKSFDWAIGIDSIILTKADTDEKGGTALSVGFVTKKPIIYLGTGQEYKDLTPFNKNKFIEELGL